MRIYDWNTLRYFRIGNDFGKALNEHNVATDGLREFFPHAPTKNSFAVYEQETKDYTDMEEMEKKSNTHITDSDYLCVRQFLVTRFVSKLWLLYKDLSRIHSINFGTQSILLAYDYIPPSEMKWLCSSADLLEPTSVSNNSPNFDVTVKLIDFENIQESHRPNTPDENILYCIKNLIKYLEDLKE